MVKGSMIGLKSCEALDFVAVGSEATDSVKEASRVVWMDYQIQAQTLTGHSAPRIGIT